MCMPLVFCWRRTNHSFALSRAPRDCSWATKEPTNESPWTYLRGLFRVRPGTAPAAPAAPAAAAAEAPPPAPGGAEAASGAAAPAAPLAAPAAGTGSSPAGGSTTGASAAGGWRFREVPTLKARVAALRETDAGGASGPLLSLLLDMAEDELAVADAESRAASAASAKEEALELCGVLTEADPVRAPFWKLRAEKIRALAAGTA